MRHCLFVPKTSTQKAHVQRECEGSGTTHIHWDEGSGICSEDARVVIACQGRREIWEKEGAHCEKNDKARKISAVIVK